MVYYTNSSQLRDASLSKLGRYSGILYKFKQTKRCRVLRKLGRYSETGLIKMQRDTVRLQYKQANEAEVCDKSKTEIQGGTVS